MIGEAAANSIRHAYAEDEQGTVEVSIERRDGLLDVAVVDQGQWKGPDAVWHRGMGRSITEAVTENFETDIGADGTVVTFEMPLKKRP